MNPSLELLENVLSSGFMMYRPLDFESKSPRLSSCINLKQTTRLNFRTDMMGQEKLQGTADMGGLYLRILFGRECWKDAIIEADIASYHV